MIVCGGQVMVRPQGLFRVQPRASRVFVNRVESIAAFDRTLEAIDASSSELLVYYGLGGQGKTMLCRELLRRLKQRAEKGLHVGHLDLHGRRSLEPRLALLWLRNALAASGRMSFPAFDLGFAHYWKATSPELQTPAFEGAGWLAAGEDYMTDELGAGAEQVIAGLVEVSLDSVPFVGSALKKLAGWAVKSARTTFTKKTNDAVKAIFGPDGEIVHFTELERQLPLLLAADLQQILGRRPTTRFVLFVDEYERVIENGGLSSQLRANAFDEAVRGLAARAPGLLLAVFSRERLPWSHQPPDGADPAAWQTWIDQAHHRLGGLSVADAERCLVQVPIVDPEVRRAIIDGASVEPSVVYPLLLDLQIDAYFANLTEDGRLTVPVDSFRAAATSFEDLRRKLLTRLLRDYGPETESILKRLAVARSFDRDLFIHLEKELPSGFPLDQFLRLTELSFIEPGLEDDFTMHRLVRDSLVEMLGPDEQAETHRLLAAYFEQAAALEDESQLRVEHLRALREAVYHRIALGAEPAARWWIKFRRPFFHRMEVGALIPIEQQVIDALASSAPHALRLRVDLLRLHVNELASCGLVADARSMNQLAIEIARRLGSADFSVLLEILLDQSELLQRENRLLEAEMVADQVVDAMERLSEADFATLNARALDVIAHGLERQGLWAKAESLRRTRLSLPPDPDTTDEERRDAEVSVRLMLLRDLLQQDKHAEASELRAALERRGEDETLDPTERLLFYGTLARLLVAAGLRQDARRVAAVAVEQQAASPDDLVSRRWFLHARSNLYSLLNEGDKAKRDAQDWLRSVETSPAHAEVDLCAPLLALAQCAAETGDIALAEASLDRLDRIALGADTRTDSDASQVLQVRIAIAQAKASRADDPSAALIEVAVSIEQLARLDPQAALAVCLERARATGEQLGADHVQHGRALLDVALMAAVCVQPERALRAALDAKAIFERRFGAHHRSTAVALSVIGDAQLAMGDRAVARQTLAELETLIEDPELGLNPIEIVRCHSSIANEHFVEERWTEAARLFEAVRQRTLDRLPSGSPLPGLIELMKAIARVSDSGVADASWEQHARFAMAVFGVRSPVAATAQKFLCWHLDDQKQFRRLAEARVVLASMLHGLHGADHQLTRAAFAEVAMAWRSAGDCMEAQKWFAKAFRDFMVEPATAEWWAEALTAAAHVKFSCGLLDEATADVRAVLDAELGPTADNTDSMIRALALRAQIAVASGDAASGRVAAAELERELDAATLSGDGVNRELACRRLALVHALLDDSDAVGRFAAEGRVAASRCWPDTRWTVCELGLLELWVAHKTGAPLPPGTTLAVVNEWLSAFAAEISPTDPRLGEHMLRVAGAVGALGGPEREIALLREGIEIIRRACGPFHPDLGAAEQTLARLTKAML